ncbi:LysR family transcriptional regulator [Sinisalibacter aestuarii]|uniref:LysR family transcriptional regulator n=1 Tax=Sinisalibacter aestuarii TaxID=2949426 RepID=A0ABQ5LNQ2_9RHOB|nr:LysR family transcriptional regulator [Sinisalibacter aestuarii]GKY86581.1 LysR family transcriptional regulator [Sinisalibacter aestuarii]
MSDKKKTPRAQRRSNALTPRVCEMLVALERYRNMGEAAAELDVLQSVLSRQLANVEKSLGVKLFARTTRSIEPSAEGMALIRQAALILGCLDEAQAEIAALGQGISGHIRLGVASVATAVLVPQALADFRRTGANVAFSIRDDTADRLVDDLMTGKLDAAVMRLPTGGHFQFESTILYDERIRVVCRAEHPLAGESDISWHRLSKFEWILPSPENHARKEIEMLFDKAGVWFEGGILQTQSVPLIIGTVSASDAISPLADRLARRCETTERFKILPVELPIRIQPVSVVWRKDSYHSPALKNFISSLKKTAKRIDRASPQ